tara:strand:+ start:304 stop:603 length:300 start_codon:yes stop_codon:yes gene_type:complete
MKVYRKIILDKNDKIIYEESYDYQGKWARLGIHYDYKSLSGVRAMEKKQKREKRLAAKRAKRAERQAKIVSQTIEEKVSKLDENIALDLETITNPNKDK